MSANRLTNAVPLEVWKDSHIEKPSNATLVTECNSTYPKPYSLRRDLRERKCGPIQVKILGEGNALECLSAAVARLFD